MCGVYQLLLLGRKMHEASYSETIEEQIINREQREKLLRQIEVLERQCRIEKQTRKKYELHQEIQKLRIKIKQV